MSQALAQICRLLIEDIYGPFLSEIFSKLATHGRLSASNIAQRCRIPLRQIHSGLGALLQLRLIFHHKPLDGPTIYEANTQAAYNLIRIGKIVQLAHRKFGRNAAQIMKKLAALGQASVSNLEDAIQAEFSIDAASGDNGTGSEELVDQQSLRHISVKPTSARKLICRLSEAEYIVQVRDSHFQTWSDTRQEAEAHLRALQQPSVTKVKQAQVLFEEKIDQEMTSRLRASLQEKPTNLGNNPLKRPVPEADEAFPAKRQRRGADENRLGTAESTLTVKNGASLLKDDLVICVNLAVVVDTFRDETLARLVAQRSGVLASHVYTAVLHQLQGVLDPGEAMFKKPDGPQHARTGQVIVDLDQLLLEVNAKDLRTWVSRSTTNRVKTSNLTKDHHAPERNGHANGHSQDSHGSPITPETIEQQLRILGEGESPFILRDSTSGNWALNVQAFRDRLLDVEIFHYARNRFGLTTLRLIKILADKGKVDEKWLQEIGLLSAKDLRQALAALHLSGLIELQEVPREPQRQPNRTMFLWFYDPNRAQRLLLDDTYKCMSKLLQRMKMERRKVRSTLEKVERSDVKGKEETLLASEEVGVLKKWRRRERWLLAEMTRLDESVAILRSL